MRSIIFMVLLLGCFSASAETTSETKPLPVAAITKQQGEIREEVTAAKGRYKDMPPSQRADLLSKQAGMMQMLAGKATTDELSLDQRMKVFNTLEWIEAAINNAENERMVCHREKTLGSNRFTRICRTAEEERRLNDTVRNQIDRTGGFIEGF